MRSYIFLICFFSTITMAFSSNKNIVKGFFETRFNIIEDSWNTNGYWGDAKKNRDNRYNEVVLFYLKFKKDSCEGYKDKIIKSIEFSFTNLQDSNGAMLQLGKPNHVRTALYVYAVAQAIFSYPEINENQNIKLGLDRAVEYLSKPHPFSSNHNIASMLALRQLYKLTGEKKYYALFKMYRNQVIDVFIRLDKNLGYWPESEKKWSNRLSAPYLFVQNFFLMEYLKENKDSYLQNLFQNQLGFMSSLIDYDQTNLDVRTSNGSFKKKGIEKVPISSYTIFQTTFFKKKIAKKDRRLILLKTIENYKVKLQNIEYLDNTDLYYRFGIFYF